MVLLQLPGGSNIPYLTTAERTAYEATNPVPDAMYIDSDEGKLYYWDNDAGASVEIPIGGAASGGTYTLYATVTAASTSYTEAGLIGKTVSKVFRGFLGPYKPVSGSPANTMEIQFNNTTGQLTLYSGDSVETDEVWAIEYIGSEIVAP